MIPSKLIDLISAKILFFFFHYARLVGIVPFSVRAIENGSFRAFPCKWYTYACVSLRALCVVVFCYGTFTIWQTVDLFFNKLNLSQTTAIAFCSMGIIYMQIWLNRRFLTATNDFLSLFDRIRRIAPKHKFNGIHLVLMLLKLLCLFYEVASNVPALLEFCDFTELAMFLGETYLTIGICMTLHICFVGYLSIGALYNAMNQVLLDDFCPRLQKLDFKIKGKFNHHSRRCTKQLNAMSTELQEYITVYEDIFKVGQRFHRLLEVPVLYTTFFSFLACALIFYYMIWQYLVTHEFWWRYMIFSVKIFIDILLLTLAAHIAVSNSQVARRVSLYNVYVRDDTHQWDTNVDVFVNRLNLYDFKLDLLGLVDISNEMNLMFWSGMVTYLTYIVEFSLKTHLW